MTRIVTTHYRYKRPPRKRKAVALKGPAVVRKSAARAAKSGDDVDPAALPAHDGRKSAIGRVMADAKHSLPTPRTMLRAR